MDQGRVGAWVRGVLELASCGGAHEIDRDEGLASLGDRVEYAGPPRARPEGDEGGDTVVETDDGSRFRVTVTKLD